MPWRSDPNTSQYDDIYDLTFTESPPADGHVVTKHRKPSHLLRVDRSSRQQFAASSFRSTFAFPVGEVRYTLLDSPAAKWLMTQDPANLTYVNGIQLLLSGPRNDAPDDATLDNSRMVCSGQLIRGIKGGNICCEAHCLAEQMSMVVEDSMTGEVLVTSSGKTTN